MEDALKLGGRTGRMSGEGGSGRRQIASQIIGEMMKIDPERAMNVAKSWAAGVEDSSRRKEETDFKTLEEYIPYRAYDVGYK
jgi:ophiobolin F synthase